MLTDTSIELDRVVEGDDRLRRHFAKNDGFLPTADGYESRLLEREPSSYITALPSTYSLPVNELLRNVFLFLSADVPTLMAVSHTCRAWRERSNWLPQWSIVGAPTRDDFNKRCLSLQEVKMSQKREADVQRAMRENAKRRDLNRNAGVAAILVGMLTVLQFALLAIAFGVGYGKNSSSGNVLIGCGAFFAVLLVGLLLYPWFFVASGDSFRYPYRQSGTERITMLGTASFVMCLVLCIPLGHVGGRLRAITTIGERPVLRVSCETSTYKTLWDYDDPPAFLEFVEPKHWTIPKHADITSYGDERDIHYTKLQYVGPPCPDNVTDGYPLVKLTLVHNQYEQLKNFTAPETYIWHPDRVHRVLVEVPYYDQSFGDFGNDWYDDKGPWLRHRYLAFSLEAAAPTSHKEVDDMKKDLGAGIGIGVAVVFVMWCSFVAVAATPGNTYRIVLGVFSAMFLSGVPMIIFGSVCYASDVWWCPLGDGEGITMIVFGVVIFVAAMVAIRIAW